MPDIRLSPAIGDPSPQLQALIRWLDAIAKEDVNALEDSMAHDFVHQVFPLSLGRSPRNKAEFLAYQRNQLMRMFKNVEVSGTRTTHLRTLSDLTSISGSLL